MMFVSSKMKKMWMTIMFLLGQVVCRPCLRRVHDYLFVPNPMNIECVWWHINVFNEISQVTNICLSETMSFGLSRKLLRGGVKRKVLLLGWLPLQIELGICIRQYPWNSLNQINSPVIFVCKLWYRSLDIFLRKHGVCWKLQVINSEVLGTLGWDVRGYCSSRMSLLGNKMVY